MTSAGGPPPGASGYSGPGGHSGPGAHEAPSGGADGLAAEVHTLERAIFEVKRIIVGQDQLVERMLVGLLSKGHVLLEGVPGVAKTLAVETFAQRGRRDVRAHPVHARPGAHRHHRYPHLPAGQGGVRHRARPGGGQLPARRRDQPGPGEGAVGAAGGHAGTPGVDRRQDLPAAQPVPGDGDAEPDRARGRLPAARGAAGPLPVQDQRRLPLAGGGAGDHLPDGRQAAGAQADPGHRRPAAAAGHRGQQLRPPRAGRLRGARRHGHPLPRAARDERRQDLDLVRRIAACLAGHHRGVAFAGVGAGPRLRDPAGRRRGHSRRAAAPVGAHL